MMLKFVVPALYLALAVWAWVDFLWRPPDGLAKVGLMVVTIPVTVLGLLLTELRGGGRFVLLPEGFGYYADHALYYWPSVRLITLLLYAIARAFSP